MKRLSVNKLKVMPGFLFILLIIGTALFSGCGFNSPLTLGPTEDLRATFQAKTSGPVLVGDQAPLILTIEAKNKVSFQIPELAEIAGLEIQKNTSPKPEVFSNGARQTLRYTLTGWQAGKYTLPALNIQFENAAGVKGTYRIPELPIEIGSVLPHNKPAADLLGLDIKPIKNPVGLTPRYRLFQQYLTGIAILLLIWVALRGLYRKYLRRPGEAEVAIPPEPAHIIALRRLTAIREGQFLANQEFNAYYSELSECIREYIENRYQIRALEMTTEEFLNHLIRNPLLDPKYQNALQDFLNQSDLVKFAKQSPALAEAEQALMMIEEIIAVTKDEPNPAEENIA